MRWGLRRAIAERPSLTFVGRDAEDKKLCRNVLIYGSCRYEDTGCLFSHDAVRPSSHSSDYDGLLTRPILPLLSARFVVERAAISHLGSSVSTSLARRGRQGERCGASITSDGAALALRQELTGWLSSSTLALQTRLLTFCDGIDR